MLLSGDTGSAAVWACRKASFSLTLGGLLPAVYGTSAVRLFERPFAGLWLFKDEKKIIALVIFNFLYHIRIEVLWSSNCIRDCLRLCKLKKKRKCHISRLMVTFFITYIHMYICIFTLVLCTRSPAPQHFVTAPNIHVHKIQILSWMQPCGLVRTVSETEHDDTQSLWFLASTF